MPGEGWDFCPNSGKNIALYVPSRDAHPRMSDPGEFDELIGYLTRTTRLTTAEAQRVVREVIGYLNETPEEFVRRRHRALQAEGLANPAIYLQLAAELSARRFRAAPVSERQIRRMIYG